MGNLALVNRFPLDQGLKQGPQIGLREVAVGELGKAQFYLGNDVAQRRVGLHVHIPSLSVEPIAKLGQRNLAAKISGQVTLHVLEGRFSHGSY